MNSGNLNLNTNTDLRMKIQGGGGTQTVTLNGGAITSYGDNKTTANGAGVVDLMAAASTATNTFHLNNGTLTIRQVMTTNDGGTATFNFNGGMLKATGTDANFLILGGANQKAVVKTGGAIVDSNTFNVTIAQALLHDTTLGATADGGLTKSSAGNLTLTSAQNDYTGNTTVNGGTLTLADNARLKFVLGATGVNNKITGSGAVQLDGDFTLDTTAAGTTPGDSWQIVDVGTLAETYGSTFTVVGGSQIGAGVWLVGSYRFTQSTGVVDYLADTDADGLPDEWEMTFFGDLDETGSPTRTVTSPPTPRSWFGSQSDQHSIHPHRRRCRRHARRLGNRPLRQHHCDQRQRGRSRRRRFHQRSGKHRHHRSLSVLVLPRQHRGVSNGGRRHRSIRFQRSHPTWTNSLAPLAGYNYATRDFLLRTPADAAKLYVCR